MWRHLMMMMWLFIIAVGYSDVGLLRNGGKAYFVRRVAKGQFTLSKHLGWFCTNIYKKETLSLWVFGFKYLKKICQISHNFVNLLRSYKSWFCNVEIGLWRVFPRAKKRFMKDSCWRHKRVRAIVDFTKWQNIQQLKMRHVFPRKYSKKCLLQWWRTISSKKTVTWSKFEIFCAPPIFCLLFFPYPFYLKLFQIRSLFLLQLLASFDVQEQKMGKRSQKRSEKKY